jgi:hypothetical protein
MVRSKLLMASKQANKDAGAISVSLSLKEKVPLFLKKIKVQ